MPNVIISQKIFIVSYKLKKKIIVPYLKVHPSRV